MLFTAVHWIKLFSEHHIWISIAKLVVLLKLLSFLIATSLLFCSTISLLVLHLQLALPPLLLTF